MSQATTINIRMDETLKSKFVAFCEATGMSMSTAFTLFAKDVVRNQALPFAVTTKRRVSPDPFYSDANQARLRASISQLESGRWTKRDLKDLND